ncbi:MAG: methyltransferase domain-containing protein [Tissierellia bacterium]|nr:methyltransferase domain-containing protein [Tissierellia bacterium]
MSDTKNIAKNEFYREPLDFELESTSLWSFPERGSWATHNGDYRGNWSPYIPRNLILRYSIKNDYVLDPFLGSGTTLVEAKLLKRHGIGIDINPKALEIAKKNLDFKAEPGYEPILIEGDAQKLFKIKNSSIDLICAHPPYSNIIKYSKDIKGDISLLDIDDFLESISFVAKELYRVLKPNKYCAVLIGDIRKRGNVIPLSYMLMENFLYSGFLLKEIVIKSQHNCKSTKYWRDRSIKYNFLLLAHEYLFIFRKPL